MFSFFLRLSLFLEKCYFNSFDCLENYCGAFVKNRNRLKAWSYRLNCSYFSYSYLKYFSSCKSWKINYTICYYHSHLEQIFLNFTNFRIARFWKNRGFQKIKKRLFCSELKNKTKAHKTKKKTIVDKTLADLLKLYQMTEFSLN